MLRTLDLRDCELGETGAINLGRALLINTHLETLLLEDNNIRTLGLRALLCGGGLSLRELNLADNKLGSRGATYLGSMLCQLTALISLDLSYNDLGDLGASGITQNDNLIHLVHLSLGGNSLTDNAAADLVRSLRSSTSIRQLDLENNAFLAPDEAAVFSQLPPQCAVLGLNLHFPFS